MERSRTPLHAGSWYNGNAELLRTELRTLIHNVELHHLESSCPKSIICPHAGYKYCGVTAAHCWKPILPFRNKINRIIILAPSHHVGFTGFALPFHGCEQYLTPCGPLPLDLKAIASLEKHNHAHRFTRRQDEDEHSVEMMLPFLHAVFTAGDEEEGSESKRPLPTLVPVIVGSLQGNDLATEIALALLPFFEDSNTLFVISSDFCHWGRRFSYKYLPDDGDALTVPKSVNDRIKSLDVEGIQWIVAHDKNKFTEYLNTTQNSICGANPILVLLNILERTNVALTTKFLHYSQSSVIRDVDSDDTSVSYAALLTSYVDQVTGN